MGIPRKITIEFVDWNCWRNRNPSLFRGVRRNFTIYLCWSAGWIYLWLCDPSLQSWDRWFCVHAGHSEIFFLEHDIGESKGSLCLCQFRGNLRTNGNQKPLHLCWCRYWEGTRTII